MTTQEVVAHIHPSTGQFQPPILPRLGKYYTQVFSTLKKERGEEVQLSCTSCSLYVNGMSEGKLLHLAHCNLPLRQEIAHTSPLWQGGMCEREEGGTTTTLQKQLIMSKGKRKSKTMFLLFIHLLSNCKNSCSAMDVRGMTRYLLDHLQEIQRTPTMD